jgi:hypothetical protein
MTNETHYFNFKHFRDAHFWKHRKWQFASPYLLKSQKQNTAETVTYLCFSILLFCRHFLFAYFNTVTFWDTAITKSEIQLSQINAHLVILPTPHPLPFPYIYHHQQQFTPFLSFWNMEIFFFFLVIFAAPAIIVEFYMHYTNNLNLHGLYIFHHSGPFTCFFYFSTTDVSTFNLVTSTVVNNALREDRPMWTKHIEMCPPLIRRVLVRMIEFISSWLHTHSQLHLHTGNTVLSLVYTNYSPPLQTH